jgi:predicted ABC-class ATPase
VAHRSLDALKDALRRIDGRGYKAYRDLRGSFGGDGLSLHLDHVQGDPFAAPSRVRVRLAAGEARTPPSLFSGRTRRIALEDWLARRARRAIARCVKGDRGSGRSGEVHCDAGGQEVLERSAARVDDGFVELRLSVGLPAAGRRVLAREASSLLCDELPRVADAALRFDPRRAEEALAFVSCVENQEHVRAALAERGLVAFVADGAILPRRSGVDDRPLACEGAVPFRSPDALRVRFALPNPIETPEGSRHEITGMGLRCGVSLIVGGGHHGKSTLLAAIERGIHPHVPGDGREYVIARPDLVKIRAENGRQVARVDLRPFIAALPGGRTTEAFSSKDASGSTSQAANILEALEIGTSGLLLDEDSCATNFMVRDARMRALVADEDEPITPFLYRVREIFEGLGVSTVLVMGGVGDYFAVADTVLRMTDYVASDVTQAARRIAAETEDMAPSATPALARPPGRVADPAHIDASRGRREVKIDARGRHALGFGREELDLRALEQLVDRSQTRAIGHALHRLATVHMQDGRTIREALSALDAELDRDGLGALVGRTDGAHPGELARPRSHEIAAALNRLRSLRIRPD